MAPSVVDVVVLSLSAFFGNFGVALTGFGMAIVYLFIWQIAALSGYEGKFAEAVFIQAFSLFCVQPLLVYKADVWNNASKRMLYLFIPATLIATPLGQFTAGEISVEIIVLVGAILVTFIAIFEIYNKFDFFSTLVLHWIYGDKADEVDRHYSKISQKDAADDVPPAHHEVQHIAGLLAIAEKLAPVGFSKTPEKGLKASVCGNGDIENGGVVASIGDIEMNEKKKSGFKDSYILGKELGAGSFSIVKEGFHKKVR